MVHRKMYKEYNLLKAVFQMNVFLLLGGDQKLVVLFEKR